MAAAPHRQGGVLRCIYRGLSDSLNAVVPIQCLYGSPSVLKPSLACFVLNGAFFLASRLYPASGSL